MRMLHIAVLVLCSPFAMLPSSQAQEAPQSLTITLTSYAFTPAAIVLKAGVAVRLHLVNASDKSHSFAAKEFFAASTMAAEDQAKLHDGEIELQSGGTADMTVTPATAGTYQLKCTHFLHSAMGMTGTVTVQ